MVANKAPSTSSATTKVVTPIREYAPLCLGAGLRWEKAIEVGRGSAPTKSVTRSVCACNRADTKGLAYAVRSRQWDARGA